MTAWSVAKPSSAHAQFRREHQNTRSSLIEAADSGCPICSILLEQIREKFIPSSSKELKYMYKELEDINSFISSYDNVLRDPICNVYFSWPGEMLAGSIGGNEPQVMANFYLYRVPPQIPVDIQIEQSTGSESAFQLIESWLDGCKSRHEKCRLAIAEVASSPTRLLCVSDGKIRLVHTSKLPMKVKYLTLSHCWGTLEILKLTKQNLETLSQEIQEDNLPKTFREAIKTSRLLGFMYLWIDSLCIIQDDAEDWRKEASRMGDVYSGSSLNLSASGAKDGSEGCFSIRDGGLFRRIQRFDFELGFATPVRFTCVDMTIHTGAVEHSSVSERGWCFQERFLPTRTLHFTKQQLYWECRCQLACETFQHELPRTSGEVYMERDDLKKIWSAVIRDYSRRKLTFGKDKLIAISGVAKWLQKRTGDEYICGHWRNCLELQLLWVSANAGNIFQRLGTIPTWSWLSLDGSVVPVFYEGMEARGRVLIKVEDVQIKYASVDPFGDVLSGNLKISTGPLTAVTLSRTSYNGFPTTQKSFPTGAEEIALPGRVYFDIEMPQSFAALCYLLPILEEPSPVAKYSSSCLILKQVHSVHRGMFRRIGYYLHLPLMEQSDQLKDPGNWADEFVYEQKDGEDQNGIPRYCISLV